MSHILLFPSWYPEHPADFAGSFFRDQARALRQYGHTVGVLAVKLVSVRALFHNRRKRIVSTQFEVDEGIPTYRVTAVNVFPGIPFLYKGWLLTVARRVYSQYVRAHGKPEVLHAHCALRAGWIVARLRKRHDGSQITALTEHMTIYARQKLNKNQLEMARHAFTDAEVLIFVSESLRQDVANSTGIDVNRGLIIPNVLSDRFLQLLPKPPRERDEKRPRFLNVATLDIKKDHQTLIEAFLLVLRAYPSATLTIVGDGPVREPLQQSVKDLGIEDHVELLGRRPVDEIPRIMADADVFVLSSRHETFGVVLIEALAIGLPVVATRCGGPEGILAEGDGILVDRGNPGALADAMANIVTNMANYETRGLHSRAIKRFGPSTLAEKLDRLYGQLLRGVATD